MQSGQKRQAQNKNRVTHVSITGLWLFGLLVFAVGCSSGGAADQPTAVPTETSAPSPIAAATIDASAIPTADPVNPPKFETLKDTLAQIWAVDRQITDPERQNSRSQAYLAQFDGRKVEGWQGWVWSISNWNAYVPADSTPAANADDYRLLLLMEDPYAAGASKPKPDGSENPIEPYFDLAGLTQEQSKQFHIGDGISFSGTITDTRGDSRIIFDQAQVVTPTTGLKPSTADLSTMSVTLERTICFGACPVYKVEVLGDGTVNWEGLGFVATRGNSVGHISEAEVKDLAAMVERVSYFQLNDDYMSFDVTDAPYVNTSVSLGGKSKSIRHYSGDSSAPYKLRIVEDKIDEIVNSTQWIDNGPDDKRQGPGQ